MKRKENTTMELKTNGYFKVDYGYGYSEVYFLYRDGNILSIGGINNSEFDSKLKELTIGKYSLVHQDMKDSWGVYEIENDIIRFERWYPSEKPYRTTIREGKILNDSTFTITKSYKGNKERERNEVYKFHAFSPKPDSTNRFIK